VPPGGNNLSGTVLVPPRVRNRGRDLARLGARAPVALATIGRRTRTNAAASATWWRGVVSNPEVADPVALLDEAARRFSAAMAIHTLQGIACQGAYERAAALAEDLAPRLVSSDGELAEARLAVDLWAVAHGDRTEGAFLAEHGFHGPEEGEVEALSWREDPGPLRGALAAWAAADPGRSPTAGAARRAADRQAAEAELLARLPRSRRPAARIVLRAAGRLVVGRELGKAAFLRYLDVARLAARRLGDDAPWCTLDELRAGARPPAGLLDERRRRRAELLALELPLSWVGDPEPTRAGSVGGGGRSLAVVTSAVVEGVGASPGVVVGRARVVTDPVGLADPIAPDEVLVTHTTDPSWVTLFLTAGALVIDVGGALSHGAIIARELGIPCVIGTGDGTARIPDGAEVVVDGTTGRVTLR
jgi:phosphohistidine swiveling domain-containing protein